MMLRFCITNLAIRDFKNKAVNGELIEKKTDLQLKQRPYQLETHFSFMTKSLLFPIYRLTCFPFGGLVFLPIL